MRKIKKGDNVVVIAGRDKGKRGDVSRTVGPDFVRRFVASAAESGIDVFRLHDPLNDVTNLREASEAITAAEREFDAGLVYSPSPTGDCTAIFDPNGKFITSWGHKFDPGLKSGAHGMQLRKEGDDLRIVFYLTHRDIMTVFRERGLLPTSRETAP